ncbi:hypothetical protein [Arthrobacter sp. B1805]|uniref:hypothetical protein n=1 Tax=Arthrobacter sp. B1805 TaxID=2058892 RepID=UPI000CE409C8|nr:hypothetical protein [Arthrobacter sp. B1805]
MVDEDCSRRIAELASFILPSDAYAISSGLDGDTRTWSDSAAYELGKAIWDGQHSDDFEFHFAESLAGCSREVSLLAVELLALALLPLSGVAGTQLKLLQDLTGAVPGDPILMPDELIAGVEGTGYRASRPEDDLGQRLSWLVEYVQAYGKCPQYARVVEEGYDEYLGHEDLHERCPYEWIAESPWVSADFSLSLEGEDCGMRFDLDHMRWPDYLPPLDVRQAGEQICANTRALLGDVSGDDAEGILKDLYLTKQLVGSWEELLEFRLQEWSPF